MAKKRIHFTTHAETSVTIDTDLTDPDEVLEQVYNDADFPTLCHQCAGGGRSYNQNLELGDEWEPERGEDGRALVYDDES